MEQHNVILRPVYIDKIRPFIDTELIKVVTGIRRCGKSVMLFLIQQELLRRGINESQLITINFENMDYAHLLDNENLHREMCRLIQADSSKKYLFFDEIQEVTDWEKCINSLRVKFDCDIYITGSNARLLSGELSTYLAGRYVEITVYPLSFSEFSTLFPDEDIATIFNRYIRVGGMPYLGNLRYEQAAVQQYLSDLYASIILKDIIKRNKVREADLLERIVRYIIANAGNTFSASSITKYLKNEKRTVTVDTVLNYIQFCADSFLCYKVRRQNLQGKLILSTQEKYYIADHGFRQAIFQNNTADINLVLENIVYIELLHRGYTIYVGQLKAAEIDFAAQKNDEQCYFQVAYLLASEETIQREFGAYDAIADNYPKYILSLDNYDFSRNGIIHKNIIDWLLEKQV
ncbi:MAG: ATP-binding protein [Victivallales bacterium]|nr:ATP-binding protein [Victivallales bacterium]